MTRSDSISKEEDILSVYIHIDWTLTFEHFPRARSLVVEDDIGTETANELDFLFASGRTNDFETVEFGQFHDETTDRTACECEK